MRAFEFTKLGLHTLDPKPKIIMASFEVGHKWEFSKAKFGT